MMTTKTTSHEPAHAAQARPHADEDTPEASGPIGPPRIAGVPLTKRQAIVIGASSGIGAAVVRQLAAEGYQVAALARRAELLDELARECAPIASASGGRVFVHAHDVVDVAATPALFESIARELGGVQLVVFAAGIMPKIAPDEYDTHKDLELVAVNLVGCIAWLNQAARFMRTQREGTIVGISSIAGDRGRKGNPVYCTTKAAMNTYLEALRNRLSESGVHVCTIKPGYVDTALTQGMDKLFWLISPAVASRQILAAARNRTNVRYVPLRWAAVGLVIRSIPSCLFRKLNL